MTRVALLAALLIPASTLADERPVTIPTRDVDIVYQILPMQGRPLRQRMRWSAAEGKLRVDPPSPGLYLIVDYRTHRMATVREADHNVLELDAGQAHLPLGAGLGAGTFRRRGESQVLGLTCTEWETTDVSGAPTLACLTADGVMLQALAGAGDRQVLVEAVSIGFAAQDPAAFRVPTEYARIVPPR